VAYGVVGLVIAALLALCTFRSGARGRGKARVKALEQGSPGPASNRAPVLPITTAKFSLPARVSRAQQATQELVSKVMASPGRYGKTGSGKDNAAMEQQPIEQQRVERQRELVSKVMPWPARYSKTVGGKDKAAEQQQQRVEQQRVGQQRVGQQPTHNAPRSVAAGERTSSDSNVSFSMSSPGGTKTRSREPAPLSPAQDRSAEPATSQATSRNPLFSPRATHLI
jgi:hypothetical protein